MASDGPCSGGDDRPGPYHLHPQRHMATPGSWVQETTLQEAGGTYPLLSDRLSHPLPQLLVLE